MSKFLKWRKKQKRGAIIKPSMFGKIESSAMKKYGKARAAKIAGSVYWKTAKAKFKKASKRKKR